MKKNRLFNSIQGHRPKSNAFDLSHEKKLSMNMGDLVPIYLQEVIPGDKFKVNTEVMMRLAPMISPVMHRVNVYTHYFFVPNRLTFNEWEPFITGGEDGSEMPSFPKIHIANTNAPHFKKGTLGDFMGIPTTPEAPSISSGLYINGLPFRAYQHIYNEYYRDQNLQPKIEFGLGAGIISDEDTENIATMRQRCWEKDYFTSALPFAQRGGEVGIPVEFNYMSGSHIQSSFGESVEGNALYVGTEVGDSHQLHEGIEGSGGAGSTPIRIENIEEEGVSVSINELRQASRLQEWLERNARGGSRYIEQIFSHFGVKSSDSRLQRPEYLGGGRNPVVISEVLQTSQTNTDDGPAVDPSVQANMAGHGIATGNNHFNRRFEEHGFIIGIMSVMPRTTYQQGLPRIFAKFDKFDYFWPEFAHLGEQEVISKEIYADYEGTTREEVFGYQSRYAEYKYKESTVHGDFKDDLSFWHMGRIFEERPVLNGNFVTSDPTHRIFAVEDENINKLYVQIYNNVRAIRSIPVFNNPKL